MVHCSKKTALLFLLIFIVIIIAPLSAAGTGTATGGHEHDLTHSMMILAIQLGIIILAARLGGMLVKPLGLPSVVGELLAGIIIGPYALGALALPFFPAGFFPMVPGIVPVSVELYGFATVASIVLLFMTGLETDLSLFIKYALPGSLIGLGGGLVAFILGAGTGMFFLGTPFSDPANLFLGVFGIAASVGIVARVLSEKKKIDSPEGVTTIAAVVIQDVVGIVALAIVAGITMIMTTGSQGLQWGEIGGIAAQALGVLVGFTAIGLLIAPRISTLLKKFHSRTLFSVLAFALALILSGVFEQAGLAMIIGAYVMGLILSKTDINFVIMEKLSPLYAFFVPLFFTVMGMLVNLNILLSREVLVFGIVFFIAITLGKIIGGGIPALFLGFNKTGALRIGTGMTARGEVGLIIAGVGISTGVLSEQQFGVAVVAILLAAISVPQMLSIIYSINKRGTKKETKSDSTVTTVFDFPNEETTRMVMTRVLEEFENEGFFIHRMELDNIVYQLRKDDMFFSLAEQENAIEFNSSVTDVGFIKTVVYETLVGLHETINRLKTLAKPESLRKELSGQEGRAYFDISKYIDLSSIIVSLQGDNKEEIMMEMISLLDRQGKVADTRQVIKDVFEREATLSTGMQEGLAFPHAKTDGVDTMCFAVGLKPKGIDFNSIDGQPSAIFFLILSPKHKLGPHMQLLATIAGILKDAKDRTALLQCKEEHQVLNFLISRSQQFGKKKKKAK